MPKIKIKIPKRFYVVDRGGYGTLAIRNKHSGRFRGRRKTSGKGDRTGVLRMTRNIDVNNDGIKDKTSGLIIGRSSASVKATPRARGYVRSL